MLCTPQHTQLHSPYGRLRLVLHLSKVRGYTLEGLRDYIIPRVPQCLSPRSKWVRPLPFPQESVSPPGT
jgi:hypothetical protein